MPIYRNKETGEMVDGQGNPVFREKATGKLFDYQGFEMPDEAPQIDTSALPKPPAPRVIEQIKQTQLPSEAMEAIRNLPLAPLKIAKGLTVDPIIESVQAAQKGEISPLATLMGGTLASIVAPPVGIARLAVPAMGSFLGSAGGQTAEQLVRGNVDPFATGVNATGDAIIDTLLSMVPGGVSKASRGIRGYLQLRKEGSPSPLKELTLRKLFPSYNTPEGMEAALKFGGSQTVSDVTQNPAARFIEQSWGGRKLRELRQQGRIDLKRELAGIQRQVAPYPGPRADVQAQNMARMDLQQLQAVENTNRKTFATAKANNRKVIEEYTGVPPVKDDAGNLVYEYKNSRIVPVDLSNTIHTNLLNKRDLATFFKDQRIHYLKSGGAAKFAEAQSTIKEVIRGMKIKGDDGAPLEIGIKDYNSVQKAIFAIDRVLEIEKLPSELEYSRQMLSDMRAAMTEDLEVAIDRWHTRRGDARLARTEAIKALEERTKRFPESIRKLTKENVEPSEFFSEAFENVDKAQKMKDSFVAQRGKELMAEDYLEYFLKKNKTPGAAISSLTDPKSPSRVFLEPDQHAALLNYNRVLNNLKGSEGKGNAAVKLREAGLALTLTTSMVQGGKKPNWATVRAMIGAGLILFPGRFLAHQLADTKNAKMLARMAKLPADSPEAQHYARLLLVGMKGQQLRLQLPNSAIVQAHVNDKGKVEVDQPER